MIEHIGSSIHKALMAQGIANGRAGTRASGGIGAGDQSGGTDRLLTAQPEGGHREPMGMGKGRQPKPAPVGQAFGGQHRFGRSQGGPVLRVHVNPNASNMPTRQGRSRARLSLVRT
jgi:hypothetical protein